MSERHPTPWKVNYYESDGKIEYDEDMPILDANGKHVVETDYGVYPPDKATVEEIVAAVNEYNKPKRNYSRFDSVADAYKAFREFCRDRQRHPQDGYCAGCVCEKVTTGNCFGTWLYSVVEGGRK